MTDAGTSPLSDDDRRAAIERLHVANEEGRMDLAEVIARTERVQQAKTGQELAAITADLDAPVARHSTRPNPCANGRDQLGS